MKVVFQLMDKKCRPSEVFADVGQIHPKTNQEGLADFVVQNREVADLSALGMARLLPQTLQQEILKLPVAVIDFTHSIVMPECSNDVSHILLC